VSFVIDASLAVSWLFVDEQTPESMALLLQVTETGAVVPLLWRLEVANALQMSIRRQRITTVHRDSAIQMLGQLPIEFDQETNLRAWSNTLYLADVHRITVYDACYLELAVRRNLPLATRDSALATAAGNAGIVLLPAS
jgi:predicted nucleic acid-binding protein